MFTSAVSCWASPLASRAAPLACKIIEHDEDVIHAQMVCQPQLNCTRDVRAGEWQHINGAPLSFKADISTKQSSVQNIIKQVSGG